MAEIHVGRRSLIKIALASLMLQSQGQAFSQAYPSKPIKIIVGFAPGGPLDVVTRLIAKELSEVLGQAVVVDNKAGASGQIATDTVASSAPDGYTLLSTASTFIVNPILSNRKQPDPLLDFVAVSQTALLPTILVVSKDFPANTLAEFLEIARKRPLTYSSAGNGGPGHLAGALLAQTVKTPMLHVPFRGAAPALMEVMAGRIDFTFYTMTGLKEHVAGGRLKPLAITSENRHHLFPDVPTMTEGGVAGFDHVGAWFGILAPAGVPTPIVFQLNKAIDRVLNQASTKDALDRQGVIPLGGSSSAFKTFLERDSARWSKLIKDAGIKSE